jgi:Rrf2 family protein
MVFLAEWPGRPLTKNEIAEAEAISPGYLQQIMGNLLTAGLVKSYRGKAGGFVLNREPERITVGDALRVTEGKVAPAPCWDVNACNRADCCPTRPFWENAARMVDQLLDGTTIADLAAASKSGQVGAELSLGGQAGVAGRAIPRPFG